MKDDAQKALEELDEKLLSDEDVTIDDSLIDEIMKEVKSDREEAAIVLPANTEKAARPSVRNARPEGETEEETEEAEQKIVDKIQIALMYAASALSLGICGVLIYWLVNYL